MIIIKYGGSIVNPDGKYSDAAIDRLVSIIEENSDETFCLVIGGGKLARFLQDASQPFFEQAQIPENQMNADRDEIGIATTKINARYLQSRLSAIFAGQLCPTLLINPFVAPTDGYRIYLATGYAPGNSTDYITIQLAATLGAHRVIKISDFPVVLDIKALEFDKTKLGEYAPLPTMTWEKMLDLVGDRWLAGGNYPLDPKGAVLGSRIKIKLLIGQYSQLEKMIAGEDFVGTTVQ